MATSLDNSLMRESINKGQIVIAAPVTATVQVVDPKTVRVILARIYLDGEISEEIVEETILSMEDFWAEYAEWDLIDQDEAQVVFQQRVDDISPLLKINGYFGISQEGTLNIYEGKPSEEKVIQSFFQINMKKLKSHQQQELEKGIPVISRDRYEEVLKMYKKYARHEM
nr:intercompartmental signaling factor BofC [Anaerobacillus isosaccharinicus]QOY38445.1 intercompartmental signaling factor BofC [Anaerobacillus isosaccharinicus]